MANKKRYDITKIPSFIDMHSHFREPGFTYKETIETGIKAARAGGFSGVCTMPNTNPVCDNPKVIREILLKAKKYNFEIYPVAAITKNLDSLELVDFKELKKAGAIAFSNDGLPLLDKDVFLKALKTEELILSHCESEAEEVEWQIELFKKAVDEGILFDSDRAYFQIFSVAGSKTSVAFNCPRINNYKDNPYMSSLELIEARKAIWRLYNFVKK